MMHLNEVSPVTPPFSVDLLALDEALEALARIDPRPVRVVELRFFAGLTTPETAAALDVSTATVEREWSFAKAWLLRRLSPTE
jgi:RNA polymerase sigma factor (sigma-70 family)